MKRLLFLIILVLANWSCSRQFTLNSGDIQESAPYQTVIPFEVVKDKIVLTLTVNGIEGRYVLDTGAPMAISVRKQQAWQLKELKVQKVTDATGAAQRLSFVEIPRIKLGELEYQNIPAIVIPIENSLLECFEIDGFVGSNLLRLGAFQIDWKRQEMTIASSASALGWNSEDAAPLFVNRNQSSPYIDIRLSEGIVDRTLIDSGSDDFYALSNDQLARQQELGRLTNEIRYEGAGTSVYGLFGQAKNPVSNLLVIDTVRVGPALFTKVGIETDLDDESRIGTELLQLGTFALDYPNRQFFFRPYTELEEYDYKTFGFGFGEENGQLIIGKVWKGTPAWEAGFRPGDRVIDIEGFPMADRSFCDILLRLSAFRLSQPDITITTVKKETDIRMTHTIEKLNLK